MFDVEHVCSCYTSTSNKSIENLENKIKKLHHQIRELSCVIAEEQMIISEERNKLELRKDNLNERQKIYDSKLENIKNFTKHIYIPVTSEFQKDSLERQVNNLSHLVKTTKSQLSYYTDAIEEADYLLADYELSNIQFEKFKQQIDDLENRALNAVKTIQEPIVPFQEEEEIEYNEETHNMYTVCDLDVVNQYLELEIYRELELTEKIRKENLERESDIFVRDQNIKDAKYLEMCCINKRRSDLRNLLKNDVSEDEELQVLCNAYLNLHIRREKINNINKSIKNMEKETKEIRESVMVEYNHKLEMIKCLTTEFNEKERVLEELDKIERKNDILHEKANELYFKRLKSELVDAALIEKRAALLRQQSENQKHSYMLQKSKKYIEDLESTIKSRRFSIQTLKEGILNTEIKIKTSDTKYQDILERIKAANNASEESFILSSIVE